MSRDELQIYYDKDTGKLSVYKGGEVPVGEVSIPDWLVVDEAVIATIDEGDDEVTSNYLAHRKAMMEYSVTAIADAAEVIRKLLLFCPTRDVEQRARDVLADMEEVLDKLDTKEKCRCGSRLYKSDLPQYGSVCASCDENFG